MNRSVAVCVWCFCARLCRRRPQHQYRDKLLGGISHWPEAVEHGSANDRRHAIRASANPSEGQQFPCPSSCPVLTRMCSTLQKFQGQLAALTELLTDAPIVAKSVILHSYARLAEMYLNASEGRRAGYGIAAVNVGIWVAWQIPILRPFMMTHFTHQPLSGKTYTMLTCVFR